MKRLIILGILAALALLFGLATGISLYYRALYALGLAMAGSWLWARLNLMGVRVHVERNVRRATVGDALVERITVTNQSPLPKAWLEVQDQTTMPGNASSMVVSMGGRTARSWRASLRAERRGVYSIGPVRVTAGDPLGIFTLSHYFLQPEELVVYPATVPLPHLRLLASESAGEGSVRLRAQQVTPHAASIRDHYPGDALSRIHWPSSARTGRLMVKTFDEGMGAGLWLFLDFQQAVQRGEGAQSTDEYAATIAASIGQRYLQANLPVGVVAYGEARSLLPPERGEGQLRELLEQLARAQAEGRVPLEQVLVTEGNRFDRYATLVVITPSPEIGWVSVLQELQRRRVRTVAVLLDGPSFGGGGSSTRVREALAQAGILTYVVRQGDDLAKALAFAETRTVAVDSYQRRESLV